MSPESDNKPNMGTFTNATASGRSTDTVPPNDDLTSRPMLKDDGGWDEYQGAAGGSRSQDTATDQDDDNENPFRDRTADQGIWLGFLVAAVGAGAVGYLLAGP